MKLKFKVGDVVVFTNVCSNTAFWGAQGKVVNIKDKRIDVMLPHHPSDPRHTEYISYVYWNEHNMIRLITPLEELL